MKTLAVLMPAFNAGPYLKDSINSILNQTFADFDLYIYNDCSSDETEIIISEFNDSRIFYRKNNTNIGIAKTLNRGLKELLPRYKFIARMDADDWSFPTRLERQLKAFKGDPELILNGTQGFWLTELNAKPTFVWKYPTDYHALKLNLLFSASFGHSSVMFKSEFLIKEKLVYNENLKTCEDWDFWCRILNLGKAINLPEFLMKYRTLPNSNHRSKSNTEVLLLEKCEVIQKCWLNFGFVVEDFDVYKFYFNNEKLNKEDFINTLQDFINLFNQLAVREFEKMKIKDKKFFQYRFVRNILTYWKNSGVSRLNLSTWFLLLKETKFTHKTSLIKNLVR